MPGWGVYLAYKKLLKIIKNVIYLLTNYKKCTSYKGGGCQSKLTKQKYKICDFFFTNLCIHPHTLYNTV